MSLRRQLPAWSPLPLSALGRGLHALTDGETAARVAASLQDRFGARELLLTDSGTSALALAIGVAARRRPGPVALPGYCCYDVATAALAADAPFALYDLDPSTLGPDFDSLRRVLERGAGAVVIAHLYGLPVDVAAVRALARESGAVVIEDAAQGVGGTLGEKRLGALGDLAVLSFGRGKGLTGGRGGALLRHLEAAELSLTPVREALRRSAGGLAKEMVAAGGQWMLARPALYGIPASLPALQLGETIFRAPSPPAAISPFAAGVLEATLPLEEAESATRQRHAAELLGAAQRAPGLGTIRAPAGSLPGYLRLPLRVAAGEIAARLAAGRALGVMPGYPRALADLMGFGERRVNADDAFPGSRALAATLITLPTHSQLAPADLVALTRWMAGSTA